MQHNKIIYRLNLHHYYWRGPDISNNRTFSVKMVYFSCNMSFDCNKVKNRRSGQVGSQVDWLNILNILEDQHF